MRAKFINESILNNKTIINVDIQPEYQKNIHFLPKWVDFINENNEENNIIFLYNGYDTLGMVNKEEYIGWLYEIGINEDVIDQSIFYDKGYAFFRYCIDSNIDIDSIVDLVKYMNNNDINDSRDINNDMWLDFMEQTNHTRTEIKELLENAEDMINIPDLMSFLINYKNIVLTGGGINECLKEVEIALLALNKKYDTIEEFIY